MQVGAVSQTAQDYNTVEHTQIMIFISTKSGSSSLVRKHIIVSPGSALQNAALHVVEKVFSIADDLSQGTKYQRINLRSSIDL